MKSSFPYGRLMVLNRFKSKLDLWAAQLRSVHRARRWNLAPRQRRYYSIRSISWNVMNHSLPSVPLWLWEIWHVAENSFPLHALLCRKYLPPNYYETNAAWFEMCACCAKVFACWSCAKEPFWGDRSWTQMLPASSGNEVIFRNLKHSKARKVREPWLVLGCC